MNQFPVTTQVAKKAAAMPIRNRAANWGKPRYELFFFFFPISLLLASTNFLDQFSQLLLVPIFLQVNNYYFSLMDRS